MNSNFKVIIFDIDGTLIDTFTPSLISLQQALFDTTGKSYTKDELVFHFGIPVEETLDQLKIDKEKQKGIEDKINENFYKMGDHNKFFDGVKEVIEELDKKGIFMGIVTSQMREEYDTGLKNSDVSKHFKLVICADDTIKHKPYPDPLDAFIQKTGYDKKEVIYIGDTNYDKMSAWSANITFGLACWGTMDKTIIADYYFKEPKDILKILQK
jgi:HAD superfamily hydrolase (TIGR01549 family)